MRNFFLIFSLLSIYFFSNSQDTISSKSSNSKRIDRIALSFGLNIASGHFASNNTQSDASGLAGNGFSLNGIYTHYYSSDFGLIIKGFYNTNKFNSEVLDDMISSMINYSVYSNKENYSSYGLLIGPTFLISFNNLSVYGHLATGYGNLTEPEITFTTKTSTNYAWVKMDRISAEALLFDVGGGLSYALNKKINLFTRIDYLNGSFNFGNCTVSSYTGLSQEFERGYQKYSVINITIGLSLEIQE